MTTGALNELQQRLRQTHQSGQVVVAEVTVDPWRDTPSRLRAYARLAGVSFTQLTGTPENITRLWHFFGVYFKRVAEGHPADVDWLTHRPLTFDVDHTDGIFILDPSGRLRIVDEGMPKLTGDLSRPLRALLDAQGEQNLTHPELPWTARDVLDDLDFLMGRELPESDTPTATVPSPSTARQQLAGSPVALAGLHAQAGQLLGNGDALTRRLAALHGHPIVLNEWTSWCGPCRAEFAILAAASARYGRQVAFLGLDVNDSRSDARAFLSAHPVSYPSYADSSADLQSSLIPEYMPTTIFISPSGKIIHRSSGSYDSLAALENDIDHYALGVGG